MAKAKKSTCAKKADAKKLKGAARKSFIKSCKGSPKRASKCSKVESACVREMKDLCAADAAACRKAGTAAARKSYLDRRAEASEQYLKLSGLRRRRRRSR